MSTPDAADATALRELAERYATGVDRRDAALFLSAFDADGSLLVFDPSESPTPNRTRRGRHELADVIGLIARYDRTFHLIGNSRYDVTGDTATGEVYCVAHHVAPANESGPGPGPGSAAPGTDRVMYIRYHDEYARRDGGWRIVERRVLVDWTETRPVELHPPAG